MEQNKASRSRSTHTRGFKTVYGRIELKESGIFPQTFPQKTPLNMENRFLTKVERQLSQRKVFSTNVAGIA